MLKFYVYRTNPEAFYYWGEEFIARSRKYGSGYLVTPDDGRSSFFDTEIEVLEFVLELIKVHLDE